VVIVVLVVLVLVLVVLEIIGTSVIGTSRSALANRHRRGGWGGTLRRRAGPDRVA